MLGIAPLLAQVELTPFQRATESLARTPLSQIVAFGIVCTLIRLVLAGYLRNTPKHLRTGLYPVARVVNELADALVYAGIVVFMLVRPFAIQTFLIPSQSMVDTLLVGDMIVANKWVYRTSDPKRGDIVVFRPPQRAYRPGSPESDFIKRVVGVPGDVVEWRDRQLYVNGEPVDEPYVDFTDPATMFHRPLPRDRWDEVPHGNFKLVDDGGKYVPVVYDGDLANVGPYLHVAPEFRPKSADEMRRWIELPPAPIPARHYLMFGDNRNGSDDSRSWGLVTRENIVGKSEFIWLPVARWGATR